MENLRDLVKFAYKERIVLMADEVYQENVYQVGGEGEGGGGGGQE